MLGDAAVAVHPDDERYRHLIGRECACRSRIETFPSSAMTTSIRHSAAVASRLLRRMISTTTRSAQRHGLPLINIMTPEAALNDNVPPPTAGSTAMWRVRAFSPISRPWVSSSVSNLIKLDVPRGDRSNAVLEPLLTDQWFVDIKPLAAPGDPRSRGGAHPLRSGKLVGRVFRVDAQNQGLVHQQATMVGSPHSGVVRRRGPMVCRAQRSGGARRAWARSVHGVAAGRGRAGHLVLLGAVALLHAGLAAGHPRRCAPIIRRPSWSRASTSFSSGSPA